MTAGRIWWISRDARKEMATQVSSRYTTIAAMIIESGFLYSTTLLVLYIYLLVKVEILTPFDPSVIVTQLSGLAPTLLTVRVAYINSPDSLPQSQKVSTLAFANHSAMQESRAERRDLHSAPAPAEKAVC
ncbi:hypothetical protein V5O48_013149 [Marasmius crinis-equi]|uniref:Uncharacterized protein n=1 Tax=Marasmius crinis-equi TaxID=585013 RepID=A0ABR3F0X2_9AGAR